MKRQLLSPNLLCLTLGGDELNGFPENSETATIKLLLPQGDQDWSSYLLSLSGTGAKPLKRTYTVLEYRANSNELDVAFALHPNPGPATRWAQQARQGDSIAITGPGRVHRIDPAADWFLLAGDMAAQAAVCANIQLLPRSAEGYVFLEINEASDRRDIEVPGNIELRWIAKPYPEGRSQTLENTIRSINWMTGTPSIWIAGESQFVRVIRDFLVNDKQISQEHRHTSGYWQTGHTEDSHQMIKRNEPRD